MTTPEVPSPTGAEPPRATYVAGESDDLRAALDAFEARTDGVIALAENVAGLIEEVRDLRAAVEVRPSRREVDYKRRRSIIALAFFALAVIWAHDEHVERCGPGARAEAAVGALVNDADRESIEDAARGAMAPKSCDVTFPLHDHDDNGYPARYNVFGLALYAVAVAAAWVWAGRPMSGTGRRNRRSTDRKDTT